MIFLVALAVATAGCSDDVSTSILLSIRAEPSLTLRYVELLSCCGVAG